MLKEKYLTSLLQKVGFETFVFQYFTSSFKTILQKALQYCYQHCTLTVTCTNGDSLPKLHSFMFELLLHDSMYDHVWLQHVHHTCVITIAERLMVAT